ncbi:MAG: hypothetical protein ABGX20_00820 [Bacillus sp. (in: firmicutes)]
MMNRRSKNLYLVGTILVIGFVFSAYMLLKNNESNREVTKSSNFQDEYVNVDEFGANGTDDKDDSEYIQEAINYGHNSKIGKVKLLGNKNYTLKRGLVLKEGVELEFGQNTRIKVEGNFRVFEVKKNASVTNGIIEIVDARYDSDVFYLDGDQKFWSWDRTQISNVTIINTSGSHKGTGIHLYAGGPEHFISFVDFSGIRIAGFYTGVKLEAERTEDSNKYSFVNGNRFINFTLDDCVTCIDIDSSVTVPNESTGNDFSGLQIQLTKHTKSAITISGSDNKFEGVIWDVHLLKKNKPIIVFSKESARNTVFSNITSNFIRDNGENNYYTSPEEESAY